MDIFEDILNGVIGAFQSCFYWVLGVVFDIVSPLFEALLNGFPALRTSLSVSSEYLGYIEFIFPLTYSLELLTGYMVFRGSWLLIAIPVKYLFPGLG